MLKAISKSGLGFRSTDYEFLRKEGITLVELLSGLVWTDFNEHDPGVTLLELLCFGITDLGYRTNFNIEELLFASDKEHPTLKLKDNAFFPQQDILPCAPLTPTDYRLMIIDQISEVKDAWINPGKKDAQGYKGISSVQLKLNESVEKDKHPKILERTSKLLNANRNLCEDFEEIKILGTKKIAVTCSISISS